MYRKQVRRRRAVLALLVAASLVLLTISFKEGSGGPLHGLEQVVSSVLSPIQEGADRALKPVRDLVNWFDQTFQARGENDRLKTELQDARAKLLTSQNAASQNAHLKSLLHLGPTGGVTGKHAVSARVIARSPTVWYSTVGINEGSNAGIHVDDPVVNGDGLVGKITSVTSGTSQVTLITDHTSAVSAVVLPSGVSGVIKPEVGNPEDLLLDYIDPTHQVHKGRNVVTAGWRSGGLTSLFPGGIPIGTVSEATIEEQQTYQRVHVKPFANLRLLDFVKVLTR